MLLFAVYVTLNIVHIIEWHEFFCEINTLDRHHNTLHEHKHVAVELKSAQRSSPDGAKLAQPVGCKCGTVQGEVTSSVVLSSLWSVWTALNDPSADQRVQTQHCTKSRQNGGANLIGLNLKTRFICPNLKIHLLSCNCSHTKFP